MKSKILFPMLLFSIFINAQNELDKTDKIIDEMCLNFKSTENLNDSLRIESLTQKFILPYLGQFSDSDYENKMENLYFRFQKRCEYFRDYLQRISPPQGENWMKLNARPEIKVSDKEINQFKNNSNFYYFEYSGEKTLVNTDKKYWTEIFEDGTSSKLLYTWIGKNKFELEFIESNNNTRKNFSKKGDKYFYEIINKESNYYWVIVEIPGQSEILKFKLFNEKLNFLH
ncbi:hypothetical protein [Chryseobacterium indoltheticum]|uniref:hypothetical protein n=1 Tax=Chryseobacterium indoltheticum TaxID=254 RepID=UPI00191401B5|nr:hypothetical protein [Chryseobacterium indoltheticum]QQQ28504.1 hypothetical protein JJL46_00385 [Chryseobacterium indoltheticum]